VVEADDRLIDHCQRTKDPMVCFLDTFLHKKLPVLGEVLDLSDYSCRAYGDHRGRMKIRMRLQKQEGVVLVSWPTSV
jgi:hypothetical protein